MDETVLCLDDVFLVQVTINLKLDVSFRLWHDQRQLFMRSTRVCSQECVKIANSLMWSTWLHFLVIKRDTVRVFVRFIIQEPSVKRVCSCVQARAFQLFLRLFLAIKHLTITYISLTSLALTTLSTPYFVFLSYGGGIPLQKECR